MKTYDIGIIGGGLSGTSTAWALAQAGCSVLLLERGEDLAYGASGNQQGLATPYYTSHINPAFEVYDSGFHELKKIASHFADAGMLSSLRRSPALQFPSADRPKRLLHSPEIKVLCAQDASALCGLEIVGETLVYPESLIISPPELCAAYATHPNISIFREHAAIGVYRDKDAWHIHTPQERFAAKNIVIANAFDAKDLSISKWLFLEPVRGQLVTFRQEASHLGTLQIPLCFDGYLLPSLRGRMLLGASYGHDTMPPDTTSYDSDTEELFARLNQWIKTPVDPNTLETKPRVSFRTSTFDRLPYVGALPDFEKISNTIIRWNAISHATLPLLDGIYVNIGHGSRGLISTAISAIVLAEQILKNEQQKSLDGVAKTLDPMRLILRMIRREEICQGR